MRTLCGTILAAAITMCSFAVAAEGWNMFERRLGMFVHWGIYSVGEWHEKVRDSFLNVANLPKLKLNSAPDAIVTQRGDTLFVHFPKGLDASGVDLRPLTMKPEKVTLLNNGKTLKAKVELMPSNAMNYGRETLHVWGIPADELANECIVLRLDFAPDVLKDLL